MRWGECGRTMSAYAKRYGGRCGSSSVGRASASQAEGREFEPRFPLAEKVFFGSWVATSPAAALAEVGLPAEERRREFLACASREPRLIDLTQL
jgi:hypothetical protein